MRRAIGIAAALVALVVIFILLAGSGGDGGYKVRAIFDNANFVVKGEEVRIAGANVGSIESVDVTMPGQTATETGEDAPGKAVVVINITDPGFQDFRSDASCLIRPQSLIGEKFVECQPTQPRASGSEPPPELAKVPDGQPGAGEHLLPVERNGKTVDLDLVQNILRRPYADRFRLILNELGAGVAGRGDDLAAIVRRADPALRQTDRVLAILAQQNQQLAGLAENSDTILTPLARERAHVTGFIANANTTNAAVIERQPQFEEGLKKLPAALKDLRATMSSLRGLTDQGTPLFTDLNAIAPSLTKATKKLGPFATAGIPALTTLGDAAQTAGPKLVAADPVVVQTRDLANSTTPVATNLFSLLNTFDKTNGFKYLDNFIYNTVGSSNGYDQYGHFLRANLQITSCLDYQVIPYSGCESFFQSQASGQQKTKCKTKKQKKSKKCKKKKKLATPGLSGGTRGPVPGASALDATGTAGESPSGPTEQSDPGFNLDQGAQVLDYLFGGTPDAGANGGGSP